MRNLTPLRPSVVSTTFRERPAAEVLEIATQAQLEGIEWSTEHHLELGNPADTAALAERCRQRGIEPFCLATYFRCRPEEAIEPYIETARALGSKTLRVWAGTQDAEETSEDDRIRIVQTLRRLADTTQRLGIRVVLEYHRWTLTNTLQSTLQLLREVNHPNLGTLWQALDFSSSEPGIQALDSLSPWYHHLHLFYWGPGGFADRRPLAEGAAYWKPLLAHIMRRAPSPYCSLEFVHRDAPQQLVEDARVLREWIAKM